MRYLALACDYDGTLARDGIVDERTIEALVRLRGTGRRLLMVTGRRMEDLAFVFPHLELFDRIVGENGGTLLRPATKEEIALAEPPPPRFIETLRARQVEPVMAGLVVVATWQPHEETVLETIRDLGLELQVAFNKGAIMVLPSGVNKATGLRTALAELGLSPRNCVGVGDAENDHAFLSACECAVAVANALPALKERSDWVTAGDHGGGVVELIDAMIADDLRQMAPSLLRHHVVVGARDDGSPVTLPPSGVGILLTGPSGSGKSTVAAGLLERLAAAGYQFCIVDPEGDYVAFAGAAQIGDAERTPSVDEIIELLARPEQSLVVNLLGVKLDDRPAFFAALLPRLQELRSRTGRPHWIVVDEAHHLMPADWDPTGTLPQALENVLLITVHPDHLAPAALSVVDTVIAVGQPLAEAMRNVPVCAATPPSPLRPTAGEACIWSTHLDRTATCFGSCAPKRNSAATAASTPRASWARTRASSSAAPRGSSTCGRRTCACSCRWPTASTTTPGASTCARATTRAGCATPSRTPSWPPRPPPSRPRPTPIPASRAAAYATPSSSGTRCRRERGVLPPNFGGPPRALAWRSA